jgi:diguanylate cyclase (GGDEF)-like protein
MKLRGQIYIGSLLLLAVLFLLRSDLLTMPTSAQLASLFVLLSMATVSQFFEVRFHDGRIYYPHSVFFFAAVLLLPPFLLLPLFAIPLWLALLRTNREESYAISTYRDLLLSVTIQLLIGSSAHWLYFALNSHLNEMVEIGQVFAALVAASVYVMGNHTLFRLADVLINETTWRESGLWMADNLWAEFVMAYLGYVVAVLWYVNPVMILPMFGVLVLIQKALLLPKLKHEAQTDSKTGLLNIRYFNRLVADALARARQTERSFSVIMADLDFLRRINNNYGHLAGDLVLVGVSRIIQRSVRHEDAVARFGGEEFAVLLPDIDQEEAYAVAERIRIAIEEHWFEVPTSQTPIKTTMSLGLASYPYDAATVTDLIHQADVAVYQAKKEGRNRIVTASDLFYRIKEEEKLASTGQESRQSNASTALLVKQTLPIDERDSEFTTPMLSLSPLLPLLSPWLVKLIVFLTALGLVGWGVIWQQPLAWTPIIGLLLLAGITQYLCVRLFSMARLSIASAILFTSALLTGLPGVALVSAAIGLANILGQRARPWRQRFNSAVVYQWATDVIACLAPALLTTLLALPLQVNYAFLFGPPFVIVGLCFGFTTVGLTALADMVVSGKRFSEVWRDGYQDLPWHYLLLALIGLCFAIVNTMFGWRGMILSALPIYIMYFSQERLVGQTRQWWGNFVLSRKQWS